MPRVTAEGLCELLHKVQADRQPLPRGPLRRSSSQTPYNSIASQYVLPVLAGREKFIPELLADPPLLHAPSCCIRCLCHFLRPRHLVHLHVCNQIGTLVVDACEAEVRRLDTTIRTLRLRKILIDLNSAAFRARQTTGKPKIVDQPYQQVGPPQWVDTGISRGALLCSLLLGCLHGACGGFAFP